MLGIVFTLAWLIQGGFIGIYLFTLEKRFDYSALTVFEKCITIIAPEGEIIRTCALVYIGLFFILTLFIAFLYLALRRDKYIKLGVVAELQKLTRSR